METMVKVQKETAKILRQQLNKAGLAELHALEKRLERHYNAGTLTVKAYMRLDADCMEHIARFECLNK